MEDASRAAGAPGRGGAGGRPPGGRPMLGRSASIHFVGIGGSGMSGIAEVLLNLGYRSRARTRSARAVTDRLAALGARIFEGHAAAQRRRAPGGGHLHRGRGRQPRGGGGAPAGRSRDPAGGDAGGADAPQVRGRGGGQPRQDHHHVDGGDGPRQGRPRPDGRGGRPRWACWAPARAWARASSWWRRRTSPTARS